MFALLDFSEHWSQRDAAHLRVFFCPSAQKATAKGVSFVRVVVKGLGPGRLVSSFYKEIFKAIPDKTTIYF